MHLGAQHIRGVDNKEIMKLVAAEEIRFKGQLSYLLFSRLRFIFATYSDLSIHQIRINRNLCFSINLLLV